jgi:hypothetical protein
MRPRARKLPLLRALALLLLGTAVLRAQSPSAPAPTGGPRPPQQVNAMPLGSVIKDFVMPQRNAAGDLTANVTGAEANVVSLNRTLITGLKVELYDDGKVTTTITAPTCDYWTVEKRLSGHDGVLIEKPEARITAAAVDWDFKSQVAILHRNVRVVLPKFAVGAPPAAKAAQASPAAAPRPASAPTSTPASEPALPSS